MVGIHVTATEYAYLRNLATRRGETISTMGRAFLLEHLHCLASTGDLVPSKSEGDE